MNPVPDNNGGNSDFEDTRAYGVISPGTSVSHYKIVKKIGAGGMGEVYLAEDTKLKRQVALKFLLGEYTSDEEFKTRFMREAQAAAALAHPNIITIHEVAEFENRPYIAMEYVEGQSLKEVIAGKDVSIKRVFDLAIQVGEGLHKAHEAGIVHRDIKPQNILIDKDGRPKITDFGLAMLRGVPKLTRAGTTFGTMAYMSPEQAQGLEVDQRADIFSFGVLLYQMITGRLPFEGDNEATIINAIINQMPEPLARFKAGVPDPLQRIVEKALIKERDERYQHIDDLVADLKHEKRTREFAETTKSFVAAPAARPRRRLLPIIIPAAVIAVIALLIFVLEPFRVEVGPEREALAEENLLAVMYFENLADRDDPQRVGEIITDLLITDLSGSQYVNVVSSQRLYDILKLLGHEGTKKIDRSIASEVATEARARWMLQGSILQTQPQITLTWQLVEVESGNVLASQRLSGSADEDVFTLVDRLTVQVKQELALPTQAEQETDRPVAEVTTGSPEAYRHYLAGIENMWKVYNSEAIQDFERAVDLDSTFAMAYFKLSLLKPGAEQIAYLAKAVRYADQVSEKERYYIQTFDAVLGGDTERGLGTLERLTEHYPQEKEAYFWLGSFYRGLKSDPQKAIGYLKQAIEIDPLYKVAYNLLAYSYTEIDDYDNAIWAINKYIELVPDEPNPYDSRAEIYGYYGKIDEAIASYKKALEMKPDFQPSLVGLGHMYLFKREYAMAEATYKQVSSSERTDSRVSGRRLLAYVPMYQGKLTQALEVLDNGIAADAMDQAKGAAQANKHYLKSYVLAELGQFELALDSVRRGIAIEKEFDPSDPIAARPVYAFFLALSGDSAGAEREAEAMKADIETLSIEEFMMGYWFARGLIEVAQEDYDGAIPHLEKVADQLTIVPFQMRYFLAAAYLGAGRLDDAAAELEAMLSRYDDGRLANPLLAVKAHYMLGRAFEKSGWDRRAVNQYEEFLGIWKDADPGIRYLEEARQHLAHLKANS
jgi:tetratricopeptide (TPR) repeat protein/TolB-like protein/predicted Ser/Thr protein kinase